MYTVYFLNQEFSNAISFFFFCLCFFVLFFWWGGGGCFALIPITKTRLFKYIENFTTENLKFSDKNSDIFQIFAQNIDCGYSLEPPQRLN